MVREALDLIDRLIALARIRSSRRAAVFKNEIEPLFAQLSTASVDLFKLCGESRALVAPRMCACVMGCGRD